jgi:hypothetical protein
MCGSNKVVVLGEIGHGGFGGAVGEFRFKQNIINHPAATQK